ncbi:MAG: glycosyltransferase family 39 protein [Candidatus Aureabacteria bacterium]|nr:glycosyltransferase family 39 protein [Candidatus Auribacterota bacterium]
MIKKYITNTYGSAVVDTVVLLLLFGTALFIGLGRTPLLNPDESRYAEIPREMIESGDYVTPRLNYVKYFEKPPLHYWMVSLSLRVLGMDEFGARAVSSLAGLLCIVVVYALGRYMFDRRAGLLSAMVLGGSVGYLVQARLNIIDIPLTLFMTAALGSLYAGISRDNEWRRQYIYLFYLFTALATLTKGPIGILLPFGIGIAYIALRGDWKIVKEMRFFSGIALFLAVSAPWFILVSARNPEFARFYFIHEHFVRYLTKEHGRYEAPWFFLPVLIGCLFPWSLFLPSAVRDYFKEKRAGGPAPRLFLLIWGLLIFVFFSLSSSKLVPYILPMFPAAALLIGQTLSSAFDGGIATIRRTSLLIVVILALGAAGMAIYPLMASEPYVTTLGGVMLALILACGAVGAAGGLRRGSVAGVCAAIFLCVYALEYIGPPAMRARFVKKRSLRELGLLVMKEVPSEDICYMYGFYSQDLSFYARRRFAVAGVRNELEYRGARNTADAWFPRYPEFYRLWDAGGRITAVIDEHDIPLLLKKVKKSVRTLGVLGDRRVIANWE